MGYFSNGTEGEMYREKYCDRCVNNGDEKGEDGCAVWDAHLIYNGEDGPEPVLNMLIPRDADGWNKQCRMFRLRYRGKGTT